MARETRRESDIYEVISYNIKKYRKKRRWTQAQLARRSNYTHEYIRRIEAPNSKKTFSLETIDNIANALGIDIIYLFERRK